MKTNVFMIFLVLLTISLATFANGNACKEMICVLNSPEEIEERVKILELEVKTLIKTSNNGCELNTELLKNIQTVVFSGISGNHHDAVISQLLIAHPNMDCSSGAIFGEYYVEQSDQVRRLGLLKNIGSIGGEIGGVIIEEKKKQAEKEAKEKKKEAVKDIIIGGISGDVGEVVDGINTIISSNKDTPWLDVVDDGLDGEYKDASTGIAGIVGGKILGNQGEKVGGTVGGTVGGKVGEATGGSGIVGETAGGIVGGLIGQGVGKKVGNKAGSAIVGGIINKATGSTKNSYTVEYSDEPDIEAQGFIDNINDAVDTGKKLSDWINGESTDNGESLPAHAKYVNFFQAAEMIKGFEASSSSTKLTGEFVKLYNLYLKDEAKEDSEEVFKGWLGSLSEKTRNEVETANPNVILSFIGFSREMNVNEKLSLNFASSEKERLDISAALMAGCDCEEYPYGSACPLRQGNQKLTCQAQPVWSESLNGAQFSGVLKAMDSAVENKANAVVLPIWFGNFTNEVESRRVPRVFRSAMKNMSDSGVVPVLAAGDSCKSSGLFPSSPCDDVDSISALCMSSVGTDGNVASCAKVPHVETVFALAEKIRLGDEYYSGTGLAAAQGAGILSIASAVGGNKLKSSESVALSYPFLRRMPEATQGGAIDALHTTQNALAYGTRSKDTSCFMENLEFVGTPISEKKASSKNSCQSKANLTWGSKWFTYNPSTKSCKIFKTFDKTTDSVGAISGPSNCSDAHNMTDMKNGFVVSGLKRTGEAKRLGSGKRLYTSIESKAAEQLQRRLLGNRGNSNISNNSNSVGAAGFFLSLVNIATKGMDMYRTADDIVKYAESLNIDELWTAMEWLEESGFKLFGEDGLLKQDMTPPEDLSPPTITCATLGMTTCVPLEVVKNWDSNPPIIGGDASNNICKTRYTSMQKSMCGTISFQSGSCGMIVTETKDFIMYQTTMSIDSGSISGARFECRVDKKPDASGFTQIVGSASWAVSSQAFSVGSDEGNMSKLSPGNALASTQMLVPSEWAVTDSKENTIITQALPSSDAGTYDFVTQVPSLIKKIDGRRLQSTNEAFVPWPTHCEAERSICSSTDGSNAEMCQPIEIITDGCPRKEVEFAVNDIQPGLLGFSTKPLMYSGSNIFRIRCDFEVIPLAEASVQVQCGQISSTERRLRGFRGIKLKSKTPKDDSNSSNSDTAPPAAETEPTTDEPVDTAPPAAETEPTTDEPVDTAPPAAETEPSTDEPEDNESSGDSGRNSVLKTIGKVAEDLIEASTSESNFTQECIVAKYKNSSPSLLRVLTNPSNDYSTSELVATGENVYNNPICPVEEGSDKILNFDNFRYSTVVEIEPPKVLSNALMLNKYQKNAMGIFVEEQMTPMFAQQQVSS